MSHDLIKIIPHESSLICDTFAEEDRECKYWHLLDDSSGDRSAMFCNGMTTEEMIEGEERTTRSVKRGGITCPKCLEKLKYYKSVKL